MGETLVHKGGSKSNGSIPRIVRAWLRLLLAVPGLLLILPSALALEKVTLTWDPSADQDIAGYIIHYGVKSGSYTLSHDAGNATSVAVEGLMEGNTYYFVVTAYNSCQLESLPSNEVNFSVFAAATPAGSTPSERASTPILGTGSTTSTTPIDTTASTGVPVVDTPEANPAIPLGIASIQNAGNGAFQVNIVGPSDKTCEIQASTNHLDWIPLGNVTLDGRKASFTDTQAGAYPYRFYRLSAARQ